MANYGNNLLFLESAYGSAILLTACEQRRHFHGTYSPKGGTEAYLTGEIGIAVKDNKCVLQIVGKWSHACGPLSEGTFEMRWDSISRSMHGFWSEGNSVTRWSWTGQNGHLHWVSQVFHAEGVPMPKLLPEALVCELFVKNTFFDVVDPAPEQERPACSRRASSLPCRTALRMDEEAEEEECKGEHRHLRSNDTPPRVRQGREGIRMMSVADGDQTAMAPSGCPGIEPRHSFDSSVGTSGSETGSSEDPVTQQGDYHMRRRACAHQPRAGQNHLSAREALSEPSGDTSNGEPSVERDAEENIGDPPLPEVQAKVLCLSSAISSAKRGAVTTVMINNLPSHFTSLSLSSVLFDMGLGGQFDFVYVPVDFKRCAAYGYAFVNFVSTKKAKHFRRAFPRDIMYRFPDLVQSAVRMVAPVQGLEANVERYRNSPVMHEAVPAQYRPLLFQGGTSITFPSPTKSIRYPRLRSMTQGR
jgi:hypothetical protein